MNGKVECSIMDYDAYKKVSALYTGAKNFTEPSPLDQAKANGFALPSD